MPALFNSGFSVRKAMWHGLGTVADRYPADWAEAREWAGLQWEPMALAIPNMIAPNGVEIDLGGYRVIVRDDTFTALGVTSDEFEPVKNARMGEIVETVLAAGFKFETAGTLRDGRMVWALAYLDEPFKVAGDDSETLPFLAILNAHDGSGACKAIYTDVRVVCWNTYRAAEMRAKPGNTFTFRHTTGVNNRIEEAKLVMKGLRSETADWVDLAAHLFNLPLVDESAALNHFMADWEPLAYRPLKKGEAVLPDRSRDYTDRKRAAFRSLYLDSVTGDAHRGTALGLVDAAVEFVDHVQGREVGRFTRFLQGDPRKAAAVKLAMRVAG